MILFLQADRLTCLIKGSIDILLVVIYSSMIYIFNNGLIIILFEIIGEGEYPPQLRCIYATWSRR